MKRLLLFLFLLVALIVLNNLRPKVSPQLLDQPTTATPLEIKEIKAIKDLDRQVVLYKKLIDRVGPVEAQEELKNSGLPFDGQTHLLNHTVGDVLYDRYKEAGLSLCKDYFLSSCYHGFVIRAIADSGFLGLKDIMKTCWEKGEHVAVQCAHAIGHGFLAWSGYASLTTALKDCDKLATLSNRFPLYNCHDGVFMENVWAVHEDGKPSKDRWLDPADPIYPCNDQRLEYRYIKACWSNQPMRMYQMFAGDVSQVGQKCLAVLDREHQETCFDGLARQIHPLTNGSVTETFRLCSLLPSSWTNSCVISIVKATFSVGDTQTPFSLCNRLSIDVQTSCYTTLSEIIVSYTRGDPQKRQSLCRRVPEESQRLRCEKQ